MALYAWSVQSGWSSTCVSGNRRVLVYDQGMTVLEEGRSIGGLRIGRMLGHGAMGEVYRAEQLVLHRQVAVKRILPQFAGSAAAVERLAREARALASVRSPYVVQVHDLLRCDGEVLLVMELIEGGGSLRAWCGRLPWSEATCLVRHLAEGLACAHAAGVIHRDVKPDNALLAQDGTARLGDFGLARALDASQLTAVGAVLGTPAYLAPECRSGQPGAEPADIYALGCTWFHLITGQPPFRGSDVSDLLHRHAVEAPPDLRTLVADADPAVAALIAACLAKDAAARPTALQLAERLRQHPAVPERLLDVQLPALSGATAPTLTPDTAPTSLSGSTAQPLVSQVSSFPTAPTAPTTAAVPTRAGMPRWLPIAMVALVVLMGVAFLVQSLLPTRHAGAAAAVRRLAEIGQIAEARAGITRMVEQDPEAPIQDLVRDVDLAEARNLWRIGRKTPALTAYAELLGRHRGDQVAAKAVIDDLPEYEPVVLDAVLGLERLSEPRQIAAAWRWLPPGNRAAGYYTPLVTVLAQVPGIAVEARAHLSAEDDGERSAGLDVLEQAGQCTDGDRIRYHVENLLRLHSGYSLAQTSVAWLVAESAKPGWPERRAAAILPPFTDVLALRGENEFGDAVEALLLSAFPEQVRAQLAAWQQHEDEVVVKRARHMAQVLPPP
jgi:serine/threonine protein kinase